MFRHIKQICFIAIATIIASSVWMRQSTHIFSATEKAYDVVITNARVVDGAGNPWFRGSIGIKNGVIARIGKIDLNTAARVIDAGDKIVAPGFIDVHAHVEGIYTQPAAENFIRMGVTTLVTGNCGFSVTNVDQYLGRMKETPLTVNLGTLVAHGAVRSKVMGLEDREPTAEEQQQMEAVADQAMKEGALGLSSGLIYVPGTYAKTDEVVGLARVAARHGGLYATHIRSEGDEVVKAIEESIKIGEEAEIPVEISHFKISSKRLWGQNQTTLNLVRDARKKGLQVTVDQYVYTASSTSLDMLLPGWSLAGGREEGRKRLADPATKEKIVKEIKDTLKKSGFKDFSYAFVANYPANKSFNGKNIKQIAKEVRSKDDLDSQLEQIFEMYSAGGSGMVYHKMSEKDVQAFLSEPFTMIAADSSALRFNDGVPHPRGYGNNARVLGHYVRELKTITLEDAIRKMTSLPAQTFNLRNRGLLREGYYADIVIFDEKTIADKATFENPHQYAEGIIFVLVNGETVFAEDKMTGARPGQALRGGGGVGAGN
jgi:N-acyl-D-amino-acid deacylase